MGRAEAATIIHAPAAAVWDSLNDITHTPDWVVGLVGAEVVTPGEYGLGAVYHDHNRLGPFPQVTAWRVTAFEPLRRQVHESKSKVLPTTMTLTLTPETDGTRLHMRVDYRLLPRLGIVSRALERLLMNRALSGVLKQNQTNLDAYLRGR